jgi:lipopolysaccharide transport system permease protein
MIWFHFQGHPLHLTLNLLLIPLMILLMAGIGLGLGITISSLTTKYRDLALLLTFAVQLGIYATPIAYPLSFLKGKKYLYLINANPLTPIIECFRYSLFGHGTFTIGSLSYSFLFMIIALFFGTIIFNKVEKSFMDTV